MKRGSFFAAVAATLGLGMGKSQLADNTNTTAASLLKPGKQPLPKATYTVRRKIRKPATLGAFGGPKRRQARLAFISESIRQANEIAAKRRADYVARRSARWRKLVEAETPRAFHQAMQQQGLA